jgi:3-oxoacyl-[acyl-carrier protein] reductase
MEMPHSLDMTGRGIWITGGCGGIGIAMARRFLALGAGVVLFDRDLAPAQELARENAGKLHLATCDFSNMSDVDQTFAQAVSEHGTPDVLVNNVGMSPKYDAQGERLKSWTITLAQWDQIMAVNVTSCFWCARMVIPGMIERGSGRIINIGSYAARTGGYQPAPHYVASKAAVLGLTKGLAKELGGYGIQVNTINPGRIETAMTSDVAPEVNAAIIPSIPCGRLGLPDDIAKAAVFLASDLADYMTGTAIEVNGGLSMAP